MAWPNDVTRADLRVEHYRGFESDGQQRKSETSCWITHIPTGLAAYCEEYPSQADNTIAAFRHLATRLAPRMAPRDESTPTKNALTYRERRGERHPRGWEWGDDLVLDSRTLDDIMAAALGRE